MRLESHCGLLEFAEHRYLWFVKAGISTSLLQVDSTPQALLHCNRSVLPAWVLVTASSGTRPRR